MKIHKIIKAQKLSNKEISNQKDESKNKYTVRSMIDDLDKWKEFLELSDKS